MPRARMLLLVGCCLLLAGGRHTLLQGIAWSTMLAGYASARPLPDALAMTFAGEHPCPICQAIAADSDDDEAPPATADTLKHDKAAEPATVVRFVAAVHPKRPLPLPTLRAPASRSLTPEPPPPRQDA